MSAPLWGWVVFAHPEDHRLHVLPGLDIAAHYLEPACACGPALDEDGFLVHNAFDGRERYEQGRARMH